MRPKGFSALSPCPTRFRFYVVLDEEALPALYDTEAEAHAEGLRLAREFAGEHGRGVEWFVVSEPKGN